MILAAGRGKRMRPLTDQTPKPLLEINHKSLIEYQIEKLKQAGIKQMVINHAWLGQQIVKKLGDGQAWDIDIHYSPEPIPLETAGGISNALPLLGKDPFLVVNADIWCELDYSQIQLPKNKQAHLVMVNNPPHHLAGDFVLDNQNNLQMEGESKLTYSGIGIYTANFFKHCPKGQYPLAPLLHQAIAKNKLSGQHYTGFWMDIGTPQRLADLQQRLKHELRVKRKE